MKQKFERGATGMNIHHKIARQHNGSNHEDNLEHMPVVQHRAHHLLFWNDAPIKQMQTLYYRGVSTMRDEVAEEVGQLLDFWMREWMDAYSPEMFKKKSRRIR